MTSKPRKPAGKPRTVHAECIVDGCTERELEDLGVCQVHHEAGWRYVKEPDHD
ncbi:hypothetical protein [Amycolatopsis viridis]|uniref:HNH endonuclease n=1 Tax=Amycolatopsis viridis TaxID=185678 RepID=A0ABX0T2B1_9PSEU|nr:hypothetical protein [Amycolatopsis viridis]NIH81695.1 hypothetical protein [Amycolatopsis viridis]